MTTTLQWRHTGRDAASNDRRLHCLLSRLFRRRSKKTSKYRVSGLCDWNSPVTSEVPSQRASNAENGSIGWRHHEIWHRFLVTPLLIGLHCLTHLPHLSLKRSKSQHFISQLLDFTQRQCCWDIWKIYPGERQYLLLTRYILSTYFLRKGLIVINVAESVDKNIICVDLISIVRMTAK